jgi:hypothetical protein
MTQVLPLYRGMKETCGKDQWGCKAHSSSALHSYGSTSRELYKYTVIMWWQRMNETGGKYLLKFYRVN